MPLTHEIILLTDSRAKAEFYSTPLLLVGYRVKWTSDEDRAIAYIAHRNMRPDLVIIDHNPPAINGTVTLLSMKRVNPAVRIVMIGKDRLSKRFALANGAADFIRKPVKLRRFLGVLRNYIDIDMAAVSADKSISPIAGARSRKIADYSSADRLPAVVMSRPRTRIHIILAVLSLVLMAISVTTAFGLSALAKVPNPEAMVVVSVHSDHVMEKENFTMFVNGNLEYAGSTGEKMFVRLVFHYVWETLEPFPVSIILVSKGGCHLETASLSLQPGEIQGVNFYL
ncbi:MAG: response regulator [Thermoplasmata archaeon]